MVSSLKSAYRSVYRTLRGPAVLCIFAITSQVLAWRLCSQGGRLFVIVDATGRLANRLTVLANVLCEANREHGVVLDVAFNRHIAARPFAERNTIDEGIVFGTPVRSFKLFDRQLVALLVRYASHVESRSHLSPVQNVFGRTLLRGDGVNRFSMSKLPCSSKQVVLLAGIYFDVENASEQECETIRQQLRASDLIQDKVSDLCRLDDDCQAITVGVHIRQGDYRTWQNGKHFLTTEQYADAMRRMAVASNRRICFLIASDEAQNPTLFDGVENVFVSSFSELEDLVLLSRCDVIIATHSSFANWASFIGKKPICYAKDLLVETNGHAPMCKVNFPSLKSDPVFECSDAFLEAALLDS